MRASDLPICVVLAIACSTGAPPPPPPPCGARAEGCSSATDCCSDTCAFGVCLCNPVPGGECASNEDCCTGACDSSRRCVSSCGTGPCASSAQCCAAQYCALNACHDGSCGADGGVCGGDADCCQSPRRFTCASARCICADFAQACTSDGDCCNPMVCSGGLCHPAPGSIADRGPCLGDADCAGGGCRGASGRDAGTCCGSLGRACQVASSTCCSPLTCNDAAQAGALICGACLDWRNSGAADAGVARCTSDTQCCGGGPLTCDRQLGKCCKPRGVGCSTSNECCSDSECGTVGTQTQCCASFGASCGGGSCCAGLTCEGDFRCHRAPGAGCTADADCGTGDVCRAGTCCEHSGSCTSPSQCCSGVCQNGFCGYAPPYGQCVVDSNCSFVLNGTPVTRCGGSPALDAGVCCPAPSQGCALGASTCCEAGNRCQPRAGTDGGPVCCKAPNATCRQDAECCLGVCDSLYGYGCCSRAGEPCTTSMNCCEGGGAFPRLSCMAGSCCRNAGQQAFGNAALCCSGRIDNMTGYCRS